MYEELFDGGVITDRVYYSFLDRSDCFSADTKPLEDDRALWRHSQNARAQLLVWAQVIVDSKNASWAERWAANPEKYFEGLSHMMSLYLAQGSRVPCGLVR